MRKKQYEVTPGREKGQMAAARPTGCRITIPSITGAMSYETSPCNSTGRAMAASMFRMARRTSARDSP